VALLRAIRHYFGTQRNCKEALAGLPRPESSWSSFTVSTCLFCLAQNSFACLYTLAVCLMGGENPTVGPRSDTMYVSLSAGTTSVLAHAEITSVNGKRAAKGRQRKRVMNVSGGAPRGVYSTPTLAVLHGHPPSPSLPFSQCHPKGESCARHVPSVRLCGRRRPQDISRFVRRAALQATQMQPVRRS